MKSDVILQALCELISACNMVISEQRESDSVWFENKVGAAKDFVSKAGVEVAPPERQIVQIAEGGVAPVQGLHGAEAWTTALCNDGTVWQLYRNAWNRLPAIPQGDAP